jgi:hypothetical protein
VGNFCCGKLLGPANRRLDMTFTKSIPIGETMRGVIEADFFNFTNTPQGGPPVNNMRDPNFGRVMGPPGLGAGIVVAPFLGARITQIGFRFEF